MVESKTYNHQNSEPLDLVPSKLYLLLDYIGIPLGEQNLRAHFLQSCKNCQEWWSRKDFLWYLKLWPPVATGHSARGFTWLNNSILNFIVINLNLTIHVWLLAVAPNNAVLKVNFQQIIYLKKLVLRLNKTARKSHYLFKKISLWANRRIAMICHRPVRQQEIRFNDNLIFSLPGFLSMFSFETVTVLP